jgi:single-strand DNA-binding protein
LAEVAEKYLNKGSRIALEGSIRTRKYNDADGKEKYITEIQVSEFQMLTSKNEK